MSVFIAQTAGHAYRILWRTLVRFNERYKLGLKLNEAKLTATFPNGYQIWLTGCSTWREAEKLRGPRYWRAAIDEAGSVATDLLTYVIDDVLDPALMDLDGELAISGTPGVIPKGFFFEKTTGIGEAGPVPAWPTFEFTCLDNPYVDGRRYIDRKLKENGWSVAHPTFVREYLGQWVLDTDAIVYPFVANRNGYIGAIPSDRGRTRSVIAVDLGWHDDTAIVVLSGHRGHPDAWFRSAWKQPGLLPGRVAAEVEKRRHALLLEGSSVELVIDTAGGSKQLAEELKQRYLLPFEAAHKRDKKLGIESLRGALLDGTAHVDPYECGPLLSEWSALPYSDDRADHHDQYPNHCADAALYAFRRLLLPYRPEVEPPKVGTAEWHAQERTRERAEAQRRARKRAA